MRKIKKKISQAIIIGFFIMVAIVIRAPETQGQPSPPSFDADTVDGFHASEIPQADTLFALDVNAKFPNSVLYTGSENGLDADLLDGLHGSAFVQQGQVNSVTTEMLSDTVVTTAKMAANSVTQYAQGTPAPEFFLTGDGYQIIPGASVTITTTGGPILVMVNGMVRMNTSGNIAVVSIGSTDMEVGGGVAFTRYPFTLFAIEEVPSGTHTRKVSASVFGSGNAYVYIKPMIAIELKR